MGVLNFILEWFGSLQGAVITMIGIFLIGLFLAKLKILGSFRSALYVACGLIGMNAILGMFASAMVPTVMAVVERTGLQLTVLDMGVSSTHVFTFGFPLYTLFIPIGLVINIVMILLKLTDTFDVDIFNYFIWGITGIMVYYITGNNFGWAVLAFVVNEVVVLKLADITAPKIQKFYGMPGVSIPHGNAIVFAPVGMLVEFIIEKIPGLNKVNFSAEMVQKRFGKLVEPSLLGFVLGVVFGIIAGQSSGEVMMLGATVAAFMILFPKMLSTLIEGITPVAEGMRTFSEKYFKREIHIGLDAGVLVGQPEVLSAGILLVPLVLLLAFILPGNRVLPMADLAIAAPFLITACMPYHRGNIFRGLISGVVVFAIALLVCSNLAPINTWVGIQNGTPIVESGEWTSLGAMSSPFSWIIIKIFQWISGFTVPA